MFWSVWFGFMVISTTVGYLMPNIVFTYIDLVNKVKWFQVFLSITNNSTKNQSFVDTIKGSNIFLCNNSIQHKSTKLDGSK